jgi:twitching motility protein PilT
MDMLDLLKLAVARKASDLHLIAGCAPTLRVEGDLRAIEGTAVLRDEDNKILVMSILTPKQKELIINNKELDFSYHLEGLARFRVNVYVQKGSFAANFRVLNTEIQTAEELKLPQVCHQITQLKQGFVLVTGPTGSGKTTSLAAMVEEINMSRAEHIITIEDPIEYVYTAKKCIISQRELGEDTLSWTGSLKSVLREDPNIVLIGEMRDYETIAAALTIAETGHLVFATLHTNSAAQTIDRIIDVFPENQQAQVRNQVSTSIEAVFAQRLVPGVDGKRIPVVEVMLASSAVRNVIREGKTYQIDNIIQTSSTLGMMTFEASLAYWIKAGTVSLETAQKYALRPEELNRLLTI